jgi:hypothetical protein
MQAEYPDNGRGFESRLQPHCANIAIEKRHTNVPQPPGGDLCRPTLGAAKQVGVGTDADVSAE